MGDHEMMLRSSMHFSFTKVVTLIAATCVIITTCMAGILYIVEGNVHSADLVDQVSHLTSYVNTQFQALDAQLDEQSRQISDVQQRIARIEGVLHNMGPTSYTSPALEQPQMPYSLPAPSGPSAEPTLPSAPTDPPTDPVINLPTTIRLGPMNNLGGK